MKKLLPFIVLHAIIVMNSFCGILSKTAAGEEFLSLRWILLYGTMIFLLGVYAILWQQILKKIPLNVAYANKAVGVIWGVIWGALVFHENIRPNTVIGAGIVIVGVILMVTGEEKVPEKKEDHADE